jgi:hypothetical protein
MRAPGLSAGDSPHAARSTRGYAWHMVQTASRPSLAPRILVSFVAVVTMVSPYIADWNATHIYNPTWPPHAKFHNAQTMLLGLALGACALFTVWRRAGDSRLHLRFAALFGALYWITQLGSIAFPGTAYVDPGAGAGLLFGLIPGQVFVSVVLLALLGVALVLDRRTAGGG